VDGLWVGDEVVEGLGRRHCEQAGDGYGDEEGDDERPGRGATSQMGTSVRFGDEPKACEEVYRAGRVGGREEGAVIRGAMDLSPGDKLDGSDIRLQRLATQGDSYYYRLCVDNTVRGQSAAKASVSAALSAAVPPSP
jgi:hypothetical protein